MSAPTLDDLKAWLGLPAGDTVDDVVLQESLDAALASQAMVVLYPVDDTDAIVWPPDLREAIFLRTQRLAARRNSPEGVIGLSLGSGDFVSARVASGDADVLRLEGPYLKLPVA